MASTINPDNITAPANNTELAYDIRRELAKVKAEIDASFSGLSSVRQSSRLPLLVSNRSDAGQPSLSSGNSVEYSYRYTYLALASCAAVQLVFSNTQLAAATSEVLPADTVTVKAALEAPDGSIFPVYFSGAREAAMAPGVTIVSDPVPVSIAYGAKFAVRTRPKVDTLGKKWPTGGAGLLGTPENGGGAGGQDVVDAGLVSAFSAGPGLLGFQPTAILGTHVGVPKITGVVHGSSTVYGSVDTSTPDGDYGYPARVCTLAGVPHFRLAVGGFALSNMLSETAATLMARTVYHRDMISRTRPSFVLAQLGPNDVTSGITAALVKERLTRYWNFWSGLGLPIIEATWHPKVSGTYTTLEGQTTDASDAVRQEVNAWKRTMPHPGIIGVLDEAAIVQAPTDASKYRIDGGVWSADGTHLSEYGHAQAALALAPELVRLVALIQAGA